MSAVSNQNTGSLSLAKDGWAESPKFDIINGTTLAPGMRLVALNESAAQKLYEYVNECGGSEGDEWLWALINRLKVSFTEEIPQIPVQQYGRQQRRG